MISLTTFFMGNSSVATLILHLVMLIIGGLIYKDDFLAAAIGFSLIYSLIVITLIISSFLYNVLSQNISLINKSNIFFITIMYFPQYILAFLVLYKKKKSIYSLYKTIKSRNSSIIYLILFTIVLDFIASFNAIINAKDNPIFTEIILTLLFIFIIFIIIYFSNIEKNPKKLNY